MFSVDLGLRNYLLGKHSTDMGHILENVVYLELIRRGYDVYIGKVGTNKVDFIAKNEKGITYYQMALTVRSKDTGKRTKIFRPYRRP